MGPSVTSQRRLPGDLRTPGVGLQAVPEGRRGTG